MIPKLEDWFVGWMPKQAYLAPELRRKQVVGRVTGHPDFPDGTDVQLPLDGYVVKSDGKIITTRRGEVYELGEPEPGYRKFLKDTGVPFDEANPIKLVTDLQYGLLEGVRPPGGGRKA